MTAVRWSKPAQLDIAAIDAHYHALNPGYAARVAQLTVKAARFLADNQIALQAGTDLETILDSIGVEGRALDAVHLVALSAFLSSVDTTCASIRRAGASTRSRRRRTTCSVSSSRRTARSGSGRAPAA